MIITATIKNVINFIDICVFKDCPLESALISLLSSINVANTAIRENGVHIVAMMLAICGIGNCKNVISTILNSMGIKIKENGEHN